MTRSVTQARSVASVLSEVPGCLVAVDRTTGEPVEAAASPYELAQRLRRRQTRNVRS